MAENTWIGTGTAGNPHMLWEEQPAFSLRDTAEIAQQNASARYLLYLSNQAQQLQQQADDAFNAFLTVDNNGKVTAKPGRNVRYL